MTYCCGVCKEAISEETYNSSVAKLGFPLCSKHQQTVTPQALKLSNALNKLDITHTLEYSDGFKHVDIAVEWAKLYIELDGSQHAFNPKQMCADDDRDKHSLRDGFFTKRFPNNWVNEDVEKLALSIAALANKRYREIIDDGKKALEKALDDEKKAISKRARRVKFTLTGIIVALLIAMIMLGLVMSGEVGRLQTGNNSLTTQINSLQASKDQLQTNYNSIQVQLSQLNNEYQKLKSTSNPSDSPQVNDLQNQITSLQAMLQNASESLAQLKGQAGILPTYMDLVGYGSYTEHSYYLRLSLKNTEIVPITQIFVTLNSVPINVTFTYLNATVNTNTPLPPYQTASGVQGVSPTVGAGTYPLIVQAIAENGTTYTYQTTITSHL